MIDNTNQRYSFTIPITENKSDCCLRWFLNKNYVEIGIDLEDSVDNEIVFSDVLQKDL